MGHTEYQWEAYDSDFSEPEEVQQFETIGYKLDNMVAAAERFAENPNSAQGGEALAAMEDQRERIMATLYTFDYHPEREINRIRNVHDYFGFLQQSAKVGELDSRLTFQSGRKIEQKIDQMRRVRDEWKQIAEYANE